MHTHSTTLIWPPKNDLTLISYSIPTFANSATCSDLNQQETEIADNEAVTSGAGQLEQGSRAGLEQGELSTTGKKSRQPRILRTDIYAQQNNKRRRPVASKVVKKRVRVAKGK